jgi:hypothetical protein
MHVSKLLARVQVPPSHRLICQSPGCKQPIYADIHVIRDEAGAIRVIGSTCYAKLTGSTEAKAAGASYGWDGKHLTAEERDAMLADTAAFVERMEAQYAAEREASRKAAEAEAAAREAERARQAAQRVPDVREVGQPWSPQGGGTDWRQAQVLSKGDDPLTRYRAQQALLAAKTAMARVPGLEQFRVAEVADAMVQAKAQCVAQGWKMDMDGAREALERAALSILMGREQRNR